MTHWEIFTRFLRKTPRKHPVSPDIRPKKLGTVFATLVMRTIGPVSLLIDRRGFTMKQQFMIALLALGIAVMVPARDRGPSGMKGRENFHRDFQKAKTETVTISGSLTVSHGCIAVTDGGITYLVNRLARFTGFIDGLKEGAQVTLEGTALTFPRDETIKMLVPSKMPLNGRAYSLSAPAAFDRNDWGKVPPGSPQKPKNKHHRGPREAMIKSNRGFNHCFLPVFAQ